MAAARGLVVLMIVAMGIVGCGSSSSDPVPEPDPPQDQLAPNGWPVSHAPGGYQGNGYDVGDQAHDAVGVDQNGNADVALTQFYGAMILLQFGAPWCGPCQTASTDLPATAQTIEDASTDYRFYYINMLMESAGSGPPATTTDTAAWATAYTLTEPVLGGTPVADQFTNGYSTGGIPRFVVLDPFFEIRGLQTGYGGAAAIQTLVQNAWTAFINENPGWTSPFVQN